MNRLSTRSRVVSRLFAALLAAVLLAACSGIPGSGPVHEVTKVADQVTQEAPATPDAGMTPDAIVRGFIYSAARVSLAGPAGTAYAAPMEYLTTKAARTWRPLSVVMLSDQFRIDPSATDQRSYNVVSPLVATLDPDKAYHAGNGATYKLALHVVKEKGEWRISDPPPDLLIRQTDFSSVFSVRTLYFLDAAHSVVVPDRRYLIRSTPDTRVNTLLNLLLHGPAGVLKGAADSELTGGSLRTRTTTDSTGLTTVDLSGLNLRTAADRNALAAQVVWTLSPDTSQISIDINGEPLDPNQPTYSASSVESFSPDRVPGTGAVASDPYFINEVGGIVDLATKKALFGAVGTGSKHVVSASMSAATGTLAAVSDLGPSNAGSGQQLLIGQPLAYEQSVPALQADTLTQPSFSRSGDEVWVVQNGGGKDPEIYQVSTSRTSSTVNGSGAASRAKVGSAELAGKGTVTALVLSPDGVRVAIVAGEKLYLGAIAAVPTVATDAGNPATADTPVALTVVNLQQLQGNLTDVGPVAFQSSNGLMVVSNNLPGYRSIKQLKIDGSDLSQATTNLQYGDVTSMAVSTVDSTAEVSAPAATTDDVAGSAAAVYVTLGQPGTPAPILKLQGSLRDGEWVSADASNPMATSLFFPN